MKQPVQSQTRGNDRQVFGPCETFNGSVSKQIFLWCSMRSTQVKNHYDGHKSTKDLNTNEILFLT